MPWAPSSITLPVAWSPDDGGFRSAAGIGLVLLGALDWLDLVWNILNAADCVRYGVKETIFSQKRKIFDDICCFGLLQEVLIRALVKTI